MSESVESSAARSIRLLWRNRITPVARAGPRPKLAVDDVIRTAITVADEDGLGALSMRTLADRLGVKAMTLYGYVPDKHTLLDLMIDDVHGRIELPSAGPTVGATLRALLEANYRLLLAHLWLLDAYSEQPPMGPGTLGKYERELEALVPLGLPDVQTDAVLTFLLNFARASAGDYHRRTADPAGNEAWWRSVQPQLAEVLDPGEYPLGSRIGSAAGAELGGAYNAEAAYAFGGDLVVDAVCRLAGVAEDEPIG